MSQPLDLRKSIVIIRRLRVIVVLAAAFGLLVGAAYGLLKPPGVSSTAVVSLPDSVRSTTTEAVIATSDPVLQVASSHLSPPVPVDKLRSEVQVTLVTNYLLSFTATAGNAGESVAIANTVAQSYINYVDNERSPVSHVAAEMFQPAVGTSTSSRLEAMLIAAVIGALAGALIGCVAALAIGRRDRRLSDRDRIANAIGLPVLASVPVGHPEDPAGWAKLVENYQPQAVHAWQLRTLLRYFGVSDGADHTANGDEGMSLSVVSVSADRGALALGPQLAAFAASQGIPTALVIGPQQDASAVAALRTACAAVQSSPSRPSLLRVVVAGDEEVGRHEGTALSVVVVVVDDRAPKMPATVRTAATLLGVSSGRVTAEELARAAVAAGANGREVNGILVADPEPTDKTTGRVPQLIRPPRRRLPNRMKGVVTESAR